MAEGHGYLYSKVQPGFLYYAINPEKPQLCRNEWADFKNAAAADQIIGFGGRYAEKGQVHLASETNAHPEAYPLGWGMVKSRQTDSEPFKSLLAWQKSHPPAEHEAKRTEPRYLNALHYSDAALGGNYSRDFASAVWNRTLYSLFSVIMARLSINITVTTATPLPFMKKTFMCL